MSMLSSDPTTGFDTPIGISDIPFTEVSFCTPPNPGQSFCGSFSQPCLADTLTSKVCAL